MHREEAGLRWTLGHILNRGHREGAVLMWTHTEHSAQGKKRRSYGRHILNRVYREEAELR